MAWLSGWSYRKEITVTGETGAGTDYQVLFDIGDASGGDFHLEGNCTNFPEDIEVTDNDGETLLKFWIPDKTADPIEMWVKVADDLGSNQTIYIYYGKSGATTNSDIETTFVFGDDFPGSSLNLTKWDVISGTPVVSGGILTLAGEQEQITSDDTFGTNHVITWHALITDIDHVMLIGGTSGDNIIQFLASTSPDLRVKTGKPSGQSEWSTITDYTDAWHNFEMHRNATTNVLFKVDGNLEATHTMVPSTDALPISALSYTANSQCDAKWVHIRKFIATEPAFSSAGSEETASTQATTLLHGKIRIKDSTTTLADGKVQIQDTVTGLVDGLIKVQDTATGHSDGLLIVQDKVTGLVDGKVQIQDTTTNLVDGKVIVSLVSAGTDQADGKIRIKDVTTGLVDGLVKVKDSVTGLADGKIKISNIGSNLADGLIKIQDTVTGLVDGKIIITEGETSTNLFNGLLRIKDKATGIMDGLLRIIEKPINLADSKIILVDDFNGPFTATITDSQEYTAVISDTQEYTAAITDTQEYTAVIS